MKVQTTRSVPSWVITVPINDLHMGETSAQFSGETVDEAARSYEEWRDGCGLGSRDLGARFPVTCDGKPAGHVSYNGRYWPIARVTQ